MPTTPAKMMAYPIFGNPSERVGERIDADLQMPAVLGNGRLRLDHIPGRCNTRIVDLQDESGVNDCAIFVAQGFRQCEDVLLFIAIMLVEYVMIEPTRCENADESLLGAADGL